MITSLKLFLATWNTLPWAAIISILGSMTIALVAIIGGLISAYRRQKLWHETARLALEKGQPIPQSADLDKPKSGKRSARSDIRTGLILIAIGAGLYLLKNDTGVEKLSHVGAIPGFIGIALLLFGVFNLLIKDPSSPNDRS